MSEPSKQLLELCQDPDWAARTIVDLTQEKDDAVASGIAFAKLQPADVVRLQRENESLQTKLDAAEKRARESEQDYRDALDACTQKQEIIDSETTLRKDLQTQLVSKDREIEMLKLDNRVQCEAAESAESRLDSYRWIPIAEGHPLPNQIVEIAVWDGAYMDRCFGVSAQDGWWSNGDLLEVGGIKVTHWRVTDDLPARDEAGQQITQREGGSDEPSPEATASESRLDPAGQRSQGTNNLGLRLRCGKRHYDAPQPYQCDGDLGHDGPCVGHAISRADVEQKTLDCSDQRRLRERDPLGPLLLCRVIGCENEVTGKGYYCDFHWGKTLVDPVMAPADGGLEK